MWNVDAIDKMQEESLVFAVVVRRASERAVEFETNGEFPVIVCSILRMHPLVLIFYIVEHHYQLYPQRLSALTTVRSSSLLPYLAPLPRPTSNSTTSNEDAAAFHNLETLSNARHHRQ